MRPPKTAKAQDSGKSLGFLQQHPMSNHDEGNR